jgi:phosphatidylserine/phosphatidylglycerophosphate/cardiolipin synthase-like enzyme
VLGLTSRASAEELCDPAFQNCRDKLIQLIRNETVGIDVAFWFMEDARYSNELERKAQQGVPIRVIVDPRANPIYFNKPQLDQLQAAGIPMRKKNGGGILHWKMMLFDGQNIVEFSKANYSPDAFKPSDMTQPYRAYTDEVIYFSDDDSVVNSFRTKYDDLWTDTSRYANYANINTPLTRRYPIFPKDPELNFPPLESFRSRAVKRYDAEQTAIDVIIYRVTAREHSDAMIRAVQRGVPVRLYTEQEQYRDPERLWHSWNVDRMYMAGVQIRDRAHSGLNHQMTVLLRSQKLSIIGSSNWTSPSSSSQEEHNYFTYKPWIYQWLSDQFERKWNNSTGIAETKPFVPLPPDAPKSHVPVDGTTGVPTTGAQLEWYGGPWAHLYDIYFGTSPTPPLLAANVALGPSENTRDKQRYALPELLSGTTYYWRIVSKTMANKTAQSDIVRHFTTAGAPAPPPPPASDNVILHARFSRLVGTKWEIVNDASAAGGARLHNINAGASKVTTPAANPTSYAELTFEADAGKPYRLWIRARADSNHYANDSAHIQFSDSVDSSGNAIWRIGTASGAEFNLEQCSGCGLANWGWEDNGWGVGVLGPLVRFQQSGNHVIRIQTREDGVSIDQVVLSPSTYLNSSPGAFKNDTVILPEAWRVDDGGGDPPPPPPDPDAAPEIVLYAGEATTFAGAWAPAPDNTAAGGTLMASQNAGLAKIKPALANPPDYFEMTFNAVGGIPYRLWMRGRADNDYWGNDSAHVQFSGSVTSNGAATYRINTTSSAEYNLEDANGAGLSGWGWQDNGWGVGVLGPLVYFEETGQQRIRVQTREDGLSIDQIVLSPDRYLNSAPGALKNDTTILNQ